MGIFEAVLDKTKSIEIVRLPTTENITEFPTGGVVEIWHS